MKTGYLEFSDDFFGVEPGITLGRGVIGRYDA
jgi:hypothetical protein